MSANLIYNRVASCGCYKREMLSKKQSKHRQTNTRLYGIWCAMKSRCGNNNTLAYPDYGGRWITVCEEWKNSFESFMNWPIQADMTRNYLLTVLITTGIIVQRIVDGSIVRRKPQTEEAM